METTNRSNHSMSVAMLGALSILLVQPFHSLLADNAVLPTGEHVSGSLEQSRSGGFAFVRADNKAKLPLKEIEYVRFSAKPGPGLRVPCLHRITLWDGERFTGEFVSLDEHEVRFRTAWKDQLKLPRSAVAAIEQAPGYATVFVEDFEGTLAAWRLTGTPTLSKRDHTSGQQCLCLDHAGQAAEFVPTEALERGRLGINFLENNGRAASRCGLEADFQGGSGQQTVRVGLTGSGDGYSVKVTGTSQEGYLPRSHGWHRPMIDFAPRSFVVGVDNDVIKFARPSSPGTSLRKVRLFCEQIGTGKGPEGEFFFDDFSVARDLPAIPRPPGDAQQDELWLLAGDQVFGRVASANNRRITFDSRAGRRPVEWANVRGIFLRGQIHVSHGPHEAHSDRVRIWLHTGTDGEPDQLEGTVRRIEGDHLVLRHPVLGEIEVTRPYLHRLKWLAQP